MDTENPKKMFQVLENNPEVMNHLAKTLGLDDGLKFYDIYSLTDPDLLAHIPRPVHALLVIMPFTPTWHAQRDAEDASTQNYQGSGPDEPVIWFKQIIGNACGSIGLVHCLINGEPAKHIIPGTTLSMLRDAAIPLKMAERAKLLEDSDEFEVAHKGAVALGDSPPPSELKEYDRGQHFVAFVKGKDGHLWELEGSRKGPIDRGVLGEDEDVLSPKALQLGFGKVIENEVKAGGDLRFSAIALAENWGE